MSNKSENQVTAGTADGATPADAPLLTRWDIFILALSVLSLVNLVLLLFPFDSDVKTVLFAVDGVLCFAFMIDFLMRFHRAPNKRAYFLGDRGWLDLIGSLPVPGLRIARIFRVIRVMRLVREYRAQGIWTLVVGDRAGSALLAAVFMTIVVLQFGSMFMLAAENDAPDANIRTSSDALWWSYVTVTTVGYGDRYPVTNAGRLVGIAMMTIGVGLFGVLTGFLANTFLAPRSRKSDPTPQPAEGLREEIDELKRLVRELSAQVTQTKGS